MNSLRYLDAQGQDTAFSLGNGRTGCRVKRATSVTAVERRIKRAERRRLCEEREGRGCVVKGRSNVWKGRGCVGKGRGCVV